MARHRGRKSILVGTGTGQRGASLSGVWIVAVVGGESTGRHHLLLMQCYLPGGTAGAGGGGKWAAKRFVAIFVAIEYFQTEKLYQNQYHTVWFDSNTGHQLDFLRLFFSAIKCHKYP